MSGISIKVDDKSKSKDNVKVQKNEVIEAKETKSSTDYRFIRKDRDGKMFLLSETSAELESMHEGRQKVENELAIFSLKQKNLEQAKEILTLKGELLDRELRDVSTAKTYKIEEKRKENLKHAEYMDKIRKEVGHQSFSLSEDDEILFGLN